MQKITTGVLIIGSGGAGLRTAIELKEKGIEDILIVGARKFDDAHTVLAAGGINAAMGVMDPNDNWQTHAVDTFLEAQQISNPLLVEKLTKKAPEAIEDLLRFGAQFHREDDGRLTQRFFGAHSYKRTLFHGDTTGKEIIRVLVAQSNNLDVDFIEDLYIFELIEKDGKVIGAAGINKVGESVYISASKVVLATGGYSNIYRRSSSRNRENFGNGIHMAFMAGAELGDMEMVQFHPTGLVYPPSAEGSLITEAVRAEGGLLKNNLGERFMKKYDPDKLELSTRDVVARANYQEIKMGNGSSNGGVYLDISSRTEEYLRSRLPAIYDKVMKMNGINLSKDAVEVAPTAHYSMGGIVIDKDTHQTSVEGLYAVGECTTGVHGANRLGGNSLAEILVFGKDLGTHLSQCDLSQKEIPESLISKIESDIENISDGEESSNVLLRDTRDLMWRKVGIVKNMPELDSAIERLGEYSDRIEKNSIAIETGKQEFIRKSHRLNSVIQLSLLIAQSAKLRKESRGSHYRTDYPNSNDEMRFNYIIKKEGDSYTTEKREIAEPTTEMKNALGTISKTQNYVHLE
jgi:succinate dehydrogenase / fumarate reductase flavoprotein subunit